jgi:hypothetical protein
MQLANLLDSGNRSVPSRIAKCSILVIAAAWVQRAYDLWVGFSGVAQLPEMAVSTILLIVTLVVLRAVWRRSLLAHVLALGALAVSCIRHTVHLTSGEEVGVEVGGSSNATNFVLFAIVWLTVVVAIATVRKPAEPA